MNTKAAVIIALGILGASTIWAGRGPSIAVAQAELAPMPAPMTDRMPVSGVDVLMSMPLLEGQGLFLHAFGGRVRACSVDGASILGDRIAPRCSNWSN
jgi:hypothetical protein